MYYRNSIERVLNELSKRRDFLKDEIERLPEGELYIRMSGDNAFYYKRLKKEGNRKKERRVGIKKDPELLLSLVRKKYVVEAVRRLDKDIDYVESLLNAYEPSDENSVMGDFLERHPALSDGVFYGQADAEVWANEYTEQSSFHEEHLTSTASDGSHRRSLGEILIGAKLKQYGIPYRYEAPAHPDLPYIPDFTIIRPHDGKIIFWEHLGKVNDRDYMKSNKRKFAAYEDIGIVPWDNLIITYSQMNGGINEKLIDAMIQGWLL